MQILEAINLEKIQKPFKPWIPKRALFTPDALDEVYGQELYEKCQSLAIPIEIQKNNRLIGLRGESERETYKLAKSTLAVVKAPPSQFKLSPIPPSADWQFHLAQGCPAHCHYCYLAGSLSGPPVIRVYANLPSILENLKAYIEPNKTTTFEASCYTDPLSLEHITGGLQKTISFFRELEGVQLRFVSKFTAVEPLLSLAHANRTRVRISLNAKEVSRKLEGGTPNTQERIKALRKLALPKEMGGGAYPIGIVLAPIMLVDNWELHYSALIAELKDALNFAPDITFELITHRYTESSKELLQEWYPNTSLDMTEDGRIKKFNKFGGTKFVFNKMLINDLKTFFYSEITRQFPQAKILYWT